MDSGVDVNVLDLFAGAGGGLLAGKLLGWRTICAVELSERQRSILVRRQNDGILPPFPIWDDIRTFSGRPLRGVVDVVAGGFPCVDISPAGKGAGIEGEQSGLWREMARVIGEVRPRYAFIENSAMLPVRGLATVLCDLAAMGFDARWGCISAADLGADHERDRCWIVADSQRGSWEGALCGSNQRMGWKRKSVPWDTSAESAFAKFRGVDAGLARDVGRTDAIRNGQVPIVAATAWEVLTQ